MNRFLTRVVPVVLILTVLLAASCVRAEPSAEGDDEPILHNAGLSSESSALLAFFHARARTDIEHEPLHQLLHQFVEGTNVERVRATAELLGLGSLALQVLRQTVNDLDHPEAAERAARCLPWLEGPSSHKLLIAAAHELAQRKPEGAAAVLLAYVPYADNPEVITAVTAALAAVAAPAGKADPALLRGLSARLGIRRAAAAVALCQAVPPQQVPDVRELLKDPSPEVRRCVALALAEANDAEAIPVLIDLLADLPADKRPSVEEFLSKLASEWAPISQLASEDSIARKIRRDAWMVWWRNTNGQALLAVVGEHTLTPQRRQKVKERIAKLGDDDYPTREAADTELHRLGRIALPQLRAAIADKDLELSRRARQLIERIEQEPARHLTGAAVRLLALRKPQGAAEALLAYLPFAEEENRLEDVKKSLAALAVRDGKLDAALVRAAADTLPAVRAAAAEALIEGGGKDGRAAVRKLLHDDAAAIRLRVALALAAAGDKDGVPVLIDLLAVLPDEQVSQAEEALHQLAGDTAPATPLGSEPAEKKKCRDAWAAWWKVNAPRVDLRRVPIRPLLGYTLICDSDRVFEVDRQGKTRWSIGNLAFPTDAWMLPGNRVLITEWNACRVTERDRKGNVLWMKDGLPGSPVYAQRLPNGNTFIAINNNNGMMLEVDRAGKEIYKIDKVSGVLYAYRSRQGAIVCLTRNGQCLILDKTGKRLRDFALKYPIVQRGGLDLPADGRILIASEQAGKVMEYNSQGKLLREWDVPQATTATALPNDRILASSPNGNRVVELDRAGKVVWEQTNVAAYRARRR